ncbi:MAG: outer membrane lipoprotein-sorting protein [Deltaproteobacteria bacterium]|nr:outer membrane lipoprotein-sorting protein [Deltaproteobacteria bacterium]
MCRQGFLIVLMSIVLLFAPGRAPGGEISAKKLIESCWEYMRDKASESTVDMTVHRLDWERTMTIKAWTKGLSDSLIFVTAPAKDEGNGTLKKGKEMWTYNPKVNRVIKLPPSMMSQSWMGSDFSNNDLAKSDSIIHDYEHTIESMETHEGKKVYVITSMPKPAAPVVWGMQRIKLREDFVLLEEIYYDEDLQPVKKLTTEDIQQLGGKPYPKFWKMFQTETPEQYTLLEYRSLSFKEDLPAGLFTLPSLRNPKR